MGHHTNFFHNWKEEDQISDNSIILNISTNTEYFSL